DPARAVIRSVPLPESGFRYGDLLLHDGAPSGQRRLHGRTVPVFDAIEVLRPSPCRTFEVELTAPDPEAMHELFRRAADEDFGLEDWGSVRCLCQACSQGTPGPSEDDEFTPPEPSEGPARLSAAAPSEERLRTFLQVWVDVHPGARILRVEPLPSRPS
ncbi:MAG: hypothetical protein U0835_20875, partial [Isosphaeraceae bacterium]